jgi:hypothetical protein
MRTTRSLPFSMRMFCGFRSRCTTPRSCAACRPKAISRPMTPARRRRRHGGKDWVTEEAVLAVIVPRHERPLIA